MIGSSLIAAVREQARFSSVVTLRSIRGGFCARFSSSVADEPSNDDERPLSFEDIPTPSDRLPLVGHLRLVTKHQDAGGMNNLGLHKKLYKELGPVYRTCVAGQDLVYVSSPEYNQVFKAEGKYPAGVTHFLWQPNAAARRHPKLSEAMGLLKVGEEWRELRHTLQPFVFSLETAKSYQPAMVESSRRSSAHFRDYVERGALEDFTRRTAFDLFCNVALASDPATIEGTNGEALQFVHDVSDNMRAMMDIMPYSPARDADLFLDYFKPYQRYEAGLLGVMEGSLELVRRALKDNPDGNGMVQAMKKAGYSEDQTTSMFYALLIASVDTTGDVLLKTLGLLAEHPSAQDALREELSTVLKGDDFEVGADLPYMQAVMRESERYRPFSVAGIVRILEKDIVLCNYRIPAGIPIFFSEVAAIVEEQYAGKFPEEFRPERYLPDAVKARKAAGNPFIDNPLVRAPFSRGARSCLGMRVAQQELDTILARLMQDHAICLSADDSRVSANDREYRQDLGNRPYPLPRWQMA